MEALSRDSSSKTSLGQSRNMNEVISMINSCAAIVIAAKHGELIKIRDASGITYTVGTLRCKFDFRTTDWNLTTRTAVFCKGNVAKNPNIADKAIGVLLDKVDECAVPPEVLLPNEKYFSVGVWGVTDDGLRIVSKWLVFNIEDGCYVDSVESIPPTPSVYEQILTQLSSKAPIEHEHDDKYYPIEDIDKKFQDIKVSPDDIPTKVSQLENDKGYLTEYTETDPTVPAWAKSATKPTYTAREVGADPSGTAAGVLEEAKKYTNEKISTVDVSSQISTHNTNTVAHNDIRLKLQEVANKLNTFLDSDDITLDQLSEIIAYIKDNKELIESVTTNKVSVTDIIDNLITPSSNKPLSANQGVILKSLIDSIVVPSKVSQLTNDAGYLNSIPDEYAKKTELPTKESLGLDRVDNTPDSEKSVAYAVSSQKDKQGNEIDKHYATKNELSAIPKFNILPVEKLPTENISSTTVYLIPYGDESQNIYDEYIYVNGVWEKLGTQTIDLTDYTTKEELSLEINNIVNGTTVVHTAQNADRAMFDGDENEITKHYSTKDEINSIVGDRSQLVERPNDDLVTAINNVWNNAENAKLTANAAQTDAVTAITNAETAVKIAKGANQSKTFADYLAVITTLNNAESSVYNAGQNIYVIKTDVPDLWISETVDTPKFYTYSTDETFIEDLVTNGKITIGFYAVSMLETQKVNLTEYATKEELGDIDAALDEIITLQEGLILPDAEEVEF